MLFFYLALYFALAIPTSIVIWAALNAAQESEWKDVHPFENYERNIHTKTYPHYQ